MQNFSPSSLRARKYVVYYIGGLIIVVVFGLGLLTGRIWNMQKIVADKSNTTTPTKVINLNRSVSKAKTVEFDQFWKVWDKLKTKYVKDDITEVNMLYGAIQGMVMSLGDPYSIYMPPKVANEFTKGLDGELEGIGSEIGIKKGQLVVVSPLPNSPAEKAGLRPGDKIMAVNGTSTYGMDINTAVHIIRGKPNTVVTLTIMRNGADKTQDIKITRAKIIVPSIMYRQLQNNTAYLRVMQFNDKTKSELDKSIKLLQKNGDKQIVLDLRSNPGGFLESAIDVSGEWVTKGKVVVSQKGRTDIGSDLNSKGQVRLQNMKTIVLINRGSASASEIVAGALQDYNQAVVMGEKSFGKGSVQDYEIFSDRSALKLTVAEWFTPNGKNINESGVMPDIEIKEEWEKEAVGQDKILEAALELFSSTTYKWSN